jgi:ankyrin repeat protein
MAGLCRQRSDSQIDDTIARLTTPQPGVIVRRTRFFMPHEQDFFEAVKRGDAPAVSALLRRQPALVRSTGEHEKTGLHWAAEKDHVEVARVLLDAGADLEAKTSWDATALEWAAVMGNGRVADLLISRGARGLTVVVAAALGKLDAVRAMVDSGAARDTPSRRAAPAMPNDEWPPDTAHVRGDVLSDALYSAARNGHTAVVAYLLDIGAHVDAKGFFGATGLHWAAINGHRPTVDLLLSRGANVSIRDARFNATPSDWAEEGGHREIATALQSAKRT